MCPDTSSGCEEEVVLVQEVREPTNGGEYNRFVIR
jgi:hypothetical protein